MKRVCEGLLTALVVVGALAFSLAVEVDGRTSGGLANCDATKLQEVWCQSPGGGQCSLKVKRCYADPNNLTKYCSPKAGSTAVCNPSFGCVGTNDDMISDRCQVGGGGDPQN
jgi:hypothetical protein